MAKAKTHFANNAAVSAALARVQSRLNPSDTRSSRGLSFDSSLTAGDPALLRGFDTLGRENAELRWRATYAIGNRAEFSLNVTGVANAEDGDEVRLDGSHATVQWGNWLLSANTLDRWWGPSHVSSLILSNNARPMPTVMVERATAQSFETKWLSWLGPWRMSFGLSQMEHEREDIDAPLFMAWRVTVMPFKDVELGFSRTAQFSVMPYSYVKLAAQNLSGKEITGFAGRLTIRDLFGEEVAHASINVTESIQSSARITWEELVSDVAVGKASAKHLKFEWTPEQVTFEDGSQIGPAKSPTR